MLTALLNASVVAATSRVGLATVVGRNVLVINVLHRVVRPEVFDDDLVENSLLDLSKFWLLSY